MSDAENEETPATGITISVEIVGDATYEIDLLSLTGHQELWLEERTGTTLQDLFDMAGDEERPGAFDSVVNSRRWSSAAAAITIAAARDIKPTAALDYVLGRRRGTVLLSFGKAAESDAEGPTPKPARGGARGKSAGAQTS